MVSPNTTLPSIYEPYSLNATIFFSNKIATNYLRGNDPFENGCERDELDHVLVVQHSVREYRKVFEDANGTGEASARETKKVSSHGTGEASGTERKNKVSSGFQMPLHYPRFKKSDYEKMDEERLKLLLGEYGLKFEGSLDELRKYVIGTFIWPDQV